MFKCLCPRIGSVSLGLVGSNMRKAEEIIENDLFSLCNKKR